MAGVEQLVVSGQPVEECRQVLLCEWMQRNSRFVQQQNCVRVRVRAFDKEDQIEAEEPLQPGAPAFKFDFLRPLVIGDPNAEMVAVGLKTEAVVTLLPPVTKL